jgi:hypothetical protein
VIYRLKSADQDALIEDDCGQPSDYGLPLVDDGNDEPEIGLASHSLRNCLVAELRIGRAQLARYRINRLPCRKDRASCSAFGIQRFERYEVCHRNLQMKKTPRGGSFIDGSEGLIAERSY